MSENKQFELIMQDKMDGFMMEPTPSDWQAIYDRLHPRNKRRIIWWWFPAIAIVGAGLIWMNSGQHSINGTNSIAKSEIPTESIKPVSASETESTLPVSEETTELQKNDHPEQNSVTGILTKSGTPIEPFIKKSQNKITSNKKTVSNQSSILTKDQKIAPYQSSTLSNYQEPLETKPDQPLPTAANLFDSSSEMSAVTSAKSSEPIDSIATIKTTTKDVAEVKPTAIPVSSKNKKWSWAIYAGTGPNFAGEPLSLTKAMNLASMPYGSTSGNNPGRNITYSNQATKNGWHLALGIAAEKNLVKTWAFMVGLGFNSSTWSTQSDIQIDSIFANQVISSKKIATVENKYQLSMLEIPLQFNNRIAGKKAGSLWWSIGINNQFLLNLKNQTSIDSIAGSGPADSRSLNGSARKYQPQLRLGLMYNHIGKLHWQLQPLFQYSMVSVFDNSSISSPVMSNLQLQYRLFLQGKKQNKGSKK